MLRALRFALLLIAGLALLTWVGMLVATRTARSWFERDVALRAELVMNGSSRAVASFMREGRWPELQRLLQDVARDDRIMAAAACSADERLLARTREYPDRLGCRALAAHRHGEEEGPADGWASWRWVEDLPGGKAL